MSATVAGRAAGLLALGVLTWMVAASGLALPSGAILGVLHMIDLVFHEAGHVIFGFFGRFIGVLGGSLMQVLVPMVCTVAFVAKRQPASAAVTLFWVGQSLADVAVYVADGKAMALPLLADGLLHDWNYLLGTLGWLEYAERLGRLTFGLGVLAMLGALVILALDLAAACYSPTASQDSR
jgi:hypothetical protein